MSFTYGQVLNQARSRHPGFARLTLDDAAVVRDIMDYVRELIDEGAKADHAVFQHQITYLVDIAPSVPLANRTTIPLPTWVNRVYAVQATYSTGAVSEVDVQRAEAFVRDAGDRADSADWLNAEDRLPIAFLEFNAGAWQLRKYIVANGSPWDTITDLLFVVDGQDIDITRADLDTEVPLPDRALRPLAELLAADLGYRADLPDRWIERQLSRATAYKTRFVEWLIDLESSREDGFDRDLP